MKLTPAEHYAKAEKLLEEYRAGYQDAIAEAQVHATLALANPQIIRTPREGFEA